MKVLKTFYLALLFSLTMGLFCGELPETFRLRDDTSNDYVSNSGAKAAREIAADSSESVLEQRVAVRKSRVEHVRKNHSAVAAFVSGQELLRLLSTRRT